MSVHLNCINPTFVELHARSAFSFLRAASHPEEMVRRAAELGMPALAICDRDGVYGSARAHHAAREVGGVRAIVGAEVTLGDGAVVPLLVKTRTGYQNLCRLLTGAHLRSAKGEGAAEWGELEEFAEGLVCLTGDEEGPLRQRLNRGDVDGARERLGRLVRIFGKGNVCVELQRHRVRGETWALRRLGGLSLEFGLPLVASNGASFARAGDRRLHDAFTCLRHHTTLDLAGEVLGVNSERFLKGAAEMAAEFDDFPGAVENTVRVADRLGFTLENLGYQFPKYPAGNGGGVGNTEAAVLRRETFAGARSRYGKVTAAVRAQLEHELGLIGRLGFCGYFLIVWDIVNFARREGILVQGRGSAANSAVCYSLGITAADPIGCKLLFERFLSEGRNTWPDIDLDLPSGDRREAVIQEVFRKYAPRGAAMTANVITYRGRSAMREMGKVLGIPEDVLGRFSDLFGRGDYPDTQELMEHVKQSGLSDDHPRLTSLVGLYQAAYGLPRHLGQHSGGMIISDRGLDTVVPLENASMPGRRVVQWDKDDCEDMGIVKVDLLGLGMLSAIQDAVGMCAVRPGREVDLAQIPKDDGPTYDLMCRADTIGVFQIESRAQMATLPRMQPRCFYDVAIEVAIIRPGPIVGNLVHPFLNRRNGKEAIDYIDPMFEPVLKRTLGVPLFQEQVLKMAMVIADFTGSEAEELRRAISFHRSGDRMMKVMAKLRAAMERKGVKKAVQEKIVEGIQSFALYGFPESHAISFGLLAYASAWLKVHRAVEFYVGLFNNQPMGFYSPATLLEDARRHGVDVLPVCVAESDYGCLVVSDTAMRLGLRQVRGLDGATAERVCEEREKRMWCGLEDFLVRVRPGRDERRVLAKVGALNVFAGHRRGALWKVEEVRDPEDLFTWAKLRDLGLGEEKSLGNVSEDEERVGGREEIDEKESLMPMGAGERLEADFDGLSLTTGPHPMAYVRDSLAGVSRAADLLQVRDGAQVMIGGVVICRQRPGSAKGHVFVSLEDETGVANAFVPSTVFERYRLVITQEGFLKITGRLQNQDGVISVYTQHVEALCFGAEVNTSSHDFH